MHRAALLLAAGLLACHPAAGDDDDQGAEGSSSGTGEPIPGPDFLNPAVGSFRVDANQTDPEILVVQNIVPGLTQVLLDGQSLGTLQGDNTVGSLDADALSLTLHGALTIGSHTLQLLTLTPDAPLYSVELEMKVESPDPKTRPTWTSTLDPDPVAAGQTLFSAGAGDSGLLALLAPPVLPDAPHPQLRLFTVDAELGWSTTPVLVPLEGHVLSDMSFTPAVSAVAFLGPDGGAPVRLRVAHNVGLPATAIATRDVQLAPEPLLLPPVVAFDLEAALAGVQVEWAAFGRPLVVGDGLIAELHAAPDAEQPHPGDRRILSSFWRGDPLRWTPPQQIGTAAPSDIDSLGPAPVLTDIPGHRSTTLAARIGGAFPALLDVSDTGAVALTVPPFSVPLDVTGDITLATPSGEVREALAELTGINVTRGLGLLLSDDLSMKALKGGLDELAAAPADLRGSSVRARRRLVLGAAHQICRSVLRRKRGGHRPVLAGGNGPHRRGRRRQDLRRLDRKSVV